MSWLFTRRHGLLAIALMCCLTAPIAAQSKTAAGGHSVVDVVSLKSGRSLRGGIAWQEANGSLTMAVAREWLASSNPTLLASTLKNNLEGRTAGWAQTRDRILERRKTPVESPQLSFFLDQELDHLNRLLLDNNLPEPDFMWLDVAHETIVRVVRATPDRRRVALVAWNERLAHVETRDAISLNKELADRGVKLDMPPPDLAERLATRPQEDDEWAARMALVEYTLVKPLDFQGMGDILAPVRDGQPVNLAEVLPKLLKQHLGALLQDLTNEGRQLPKSKEDAKWLTSAIRHAELAKSRGFRVTRLELDANGTGVTVESRFVARMAEDQWRTIWRTLETGDGTEARPQAEARIKQDPQLNSALDTLKSLGLADSETFRQAIRVGAATMAAQQAADATFAGFRDRYVRHLDCPPLPVPIDPLGTH